MILQTFINLPVNDIHTSKDFFINLGFHFNEEYSDENAACMIINDNTYAMLLGEDFFQTFTPKKVANAKEATEVLIAFSVKDRDSVDDILDRALKFGGSETREKQEMGLMYGRSFQDLDGHIWEVISIDEDAA